MGVQEVRVEPETVAGVVGVRQAAGDGFGRAEQQDEDAVVCAGSVSPK